MVNKYDMAYGSHMLLGHSCQSKGENIWKLGSRARDGGGGEETECVQKEGSARKEVSAVDWEGGGGECRGGD